MHKLESGAALGGARLFAIAAVVLACSGASVAAQPANLEGSWSGGGKVRFPSGDTESARCRASFRRQGGGGFSMSAICATASVRVQQTATLARVGPYRFSGDFHNAEYGISGSIQITVRGKSLDASLSGGGASASFSLGR